MATTFPATERWEKVYSTKELEAKSERARQRQREARVEFRAKYFEALPEEEIQRAIHRCTALEIVEEMKKGTYTVEQVMLTMCHRALLSGETYNSNTEELFDQAIAKAREADERLQTDRESCMSQPLFGLPISIKDHIELKGTDATCGLQARLEDPAEEDAPLVDDLTRAGAIPYVKSNIPQLLLLPESTNRIYGPALNPWNVERTPGGSSGGEGTLVATEASFLGIGTDIGGSIRIPCHFCGITGFKGTPERLSDKGIKPPQKHGRNGQTAIISSVGPLARSTEDLVAVMKIWWSKNSSMVGADFRVPLVPWDEEKFQGAGAKKRLGYVEYDGWFNASPGCLRAAREARDMLEYAGYEIIPIDFSEFGPDLVAIYLGISGAEGAMENTRGGLQGESLYPTYRSIYNIALIPSFMRKPISGILSMIGEPRKAKLVRATAKKSVMEYWEYVKLLMLKREQFDELLKSNDLDGMIVPGGVLPALQHNTAKELLPAMSYTFVFNALHVPAGTVPITVVQEDETDYQPHIRDAWGKETRKVCKGSAGLPVGVQIVCAAWEDERCLQIMRDLEKEAKFMEKHRMPSSFS